MFHLRLGQNVLWLQKNLLHIFHALFQFFVFIIFVLSEKRCVRLLLIHLMFLKLSKLVRQYFFLLVCWLHHSEHLDNKVYYLPFSKFSATFFSVSFHFTLILIRFSVHIFRVENFEFFMYERDGQNLNALMPSKPAKETVNCQLFIC